VCVGTLTLTLQWYTCGFKPCLYFLQYASTCTNLTVLRCCRWHSTLTRRLGIRFSCLDSTCLIRFSFGTWSDVCYAEFLVFDSQEAEQPHECEHEQTINTLSVIVHCFQKKSHFCLGMWRSQLKSASTRCGLYRSKSVECGCRFVGAQSKYNLIIFMLLESSFH